MHKRIEQTQTTMNAKDLNKTSSLEQLEVTIEYCGLCDIILQQNSDITYLSCGHPYHARCLHGSVTRNYGCCPLCERKALIDVENGGSTDRHPLDWGDDINTEDLISGRAIILNALNNMHERSVEVGKLFGQNYESNGTEVNGIHPESVYQLLNMKETSDRKRDNESLFRSPVIGRDNANRTKFGGLISSVKNLFMTTVDPDESVSGMNISSALTSHMEANPLELIQTRVVSWKIREQFGTDAKVMIRHNITLDDIITNGYDISDLITWETTWYDMIALRLPSPKWNVWKRHAIPIQHAVAFWHVTISDFYIDVCNRDINQLANMDLNLKELKLLGVEDIDTLIVMGLRARHMAKFTTMTMQDWHSLKLTFDVMLPSKKNNFKLSPTDITERLSWITKEEDEDLFDELFKKSYTELVVEKKSKKRDPSRKHKTKIHIET